MRGSTWCCLVLSYARDLPDEEYWRSGCGCCLLRGIGMAFDYAGGESEWMKGGKVQGCGRCDNFAVWI